MPDHYNSRSCEDVSEKLCEKLKAQGMKARTLLSGGLDMGILSHEFVVINDKYIVDATWQQFLPEPNPSLPKILVVEKEKLEETLQELGVGEHKQIWLRPIARMEEEDPAIPD